MQKDSIDSKKYLVGARYWRPRWRGHGERLWRRWRVPLTRRTIFNTQGRYNPKDLSREIRIVDKRPLWWTMGLLLLAILPPLLGLQLESSSLISAACVFALYSAINLMWMLVIGTAGIFSLATLAIVGMAAYAGSWLSIEYELAWWAMVAVGAVVGLLFGFVIALPAMRLDGFYYALLTMGLVELCRVSVAQSKALGSATGGLFGAASYIPEGLSDSVSLVFSYEACFVVLLLALCVYRLVNGQRLGRLLRCAPEKHEAFAQACGIHVQKARIQIFLISSTALGAIGGFYGSHFQGASPSLFGIDNLLLSLAMIVIGGLGMAEGAVAGSLVVVAIDKLLVDWGPWRMVLIGALMLATVLYMRAGIFGVRQQFREWREKKSSTARARRTQSGGEFVPEQAIGVADKNTIGVRSHEKRLRDALKALVTPQVIAEHQGCPWGQHSAELTQLLMYFRFAPILDKYALLCESPFQRYRLIALSGERGVAPRLVDDKHYGTIAQATHAVFVKRCQDLLES